MDEQHAEALRGTDAAAAADAFAALVESRLDESYRLARLILRNRSDAEDAVHDAFLAAWRRRRSLRDAARVDAWMGRIVVNACRDRLRHARRHPSEPLPTEPEVHAGDSFGAVEERMVLESAFLRLKPDQRILIVLRFDRDLSIDQVAELLDIPAGTVKSRLHNTLRSLRELLGGEPDLEPARVAGTSEVDR